MNSSDEQDDLLKRPASTTSIHACPYANCDKFFARPSRLKTHLLSHTGERPFKCPICGKDYARNFHLKRHLKKTHNQKEKEDQSTKGTHTL